MTTVLAVSATASSSILTLKDTLLSPLLIMISPLVSPMSSPLPVIAVQVSGRLTSAATEACTMMGTESPSFPSASVGVANPTVLSPDVSTGSSPSSTISMLCLSLPIDQPAGKAPDAERVRMMLSASSSTVSLMISTEMSAVELPALMITLEATEKSALVAVPETAILRVTSWGEGKSISSATLCVPASSSTLLLLSSKPKVLSLAGMT